MSLLAHSVVDSKLSEGKRRIRKSTARSTPATTKLRKIVSIQENVTTGHKFSSQKNLNFESDASNRPKN